MGAAYAQAPVVAGPTPAPTQGQSAWTPAASPPSGANNNNNYQAPAIPGPVANPTPGTIVIHVNGKVQADFGANWTNVDSRFVGTVPTVASPVVGSAKLAPQVVGTFARLYFGADAMATNGLRYGAAIEVRENFTGFQSGSSASSYTSLETLFVRRAFTYVAGEQWGIVRVGQADGLIGIFDNGVTTMQFLPTGNFNGGDEQGFQPTSIPPTWVWMSQAGGEYGNNKIVYMSPQIAGFDFGLQYAPNLSNGFGISGSAGGVSAGLAGAGNGTGINCSVVNSGCPNLSSGPGSLDGSRILNQTAVGVRYQGKFGDLGVLAYGVYEFSGHANYTGPAFTTAAGRANLGTSALPGSTYTGNYDGLSIGSGGVAVTYAGFTLAGNVIGGRKNGYVSLAPTGAPSQIGVIVGAKYVTGPLTAGVALMRYWDQGNVALTGISQHKAQGIDVGLNYAVAPGFSVFTEYLYNEQTQAGVTLKGQGFLVGNVVNF
jgi:hypothetical protein